MFSQITSHQAVCLTVHVGPHEKHPHYWPLVRGIPRWQGNSPHKGPVTQKKNSIRWRHHKELWLNRVDDVHEGWSRLTLSVACYTRLVAIRISETGALRECMDLVRALMILTEFLLPLGTTTENILTGSFSDSNVSIYAWYILKINRIIIPDVRQQNVE